MDNRSSELLRPAEVDTPTAIKSTSLEPVDTPAFPQFSLLPIELRLKIWHIALRSHRTIRIRTGQNADCRQAFIESKFIFILEADSSSPVLLGVNKESRLEASRFYTSKLWLHSTDYDRSKCKGHKGFYRLGSGKLKEISQPIPVSWPHTTLETGELCIPQDFTGVEHWRVDLTTANGWGIGIRLTLLDLTVLHILPSLKLLEVRGHRASKLLLYLRKGDDYWSRLRRGFEDKDAGVEWWTAISEDIKLVKMDSLLDSQSPKTASECCPLVVFRDLDTGKEIDRVQLARLEGPPRNRRIWMNFSVKSSHNPPSFDA